MAIKKRVKVTDKKIQDVMRQADRTPSSPSEPHCHGKGITVKMNKHLFDALTNARAQHSDIHSTNTSKGDFIRSAIYEKIERTKQEYEKRFELELESE